MQSKSLHIPGLRASFEKQSFSDPCYIGLAILTQYSSSGRRETCLRAGCTVTREVQVQVDGYERWTLACLERRDHHIVLHPARHSLAGTWYRQPVSH